MTAPICCLALMLALPDLAWGVWGRVSAVRYPPRWAAVAAAINADPRTVAALPAGTMRRFSWAGPAPVLDPLPRWVRADVLTTGDLAISGVVVPGEGNHARANCLKATFIVHRGCFAHLTDRRARARNMPYARMRKG